MVGLVVETPLAEDNIGSGILDALNLVNEVLLLHLVKLLVVLGGLDLEVVLGLGLGGLEGAGQDAHLGILDLLLHLGVREVLVDDDSLDELRVGKGATGLGHNFNQVEVDILPLEISHVEHGLDGEVGEVGLALTDDLRAESGHGALSEEIMVVLGDVELFLDVVKLLDSDIAGLLKSVRNFKRVNSLVQQPLSLLQNGSGEHHNTRSSVSDFVVLGGGKLNQQSGGLVVDLHLLEDSGSVVGDDDLSVGADEHLVHSLGAEGSLEETGNSPGSEDVDFMGFKSLNSLLLLLFAQNNERAATFVEG
mmetsp:Transcript_40263/g.61440  ORF Transcript_40263/g.61440 Transcript_40263/m.61440 type:complete len:306 (-) Transcript_40263:19-936(-)